MKDAFFPMKNLVWISGNFQCLMEQHILEFPKKRKPREVNTNFSIMSYPQSSPIWISSWNFQSFQLNSSLLGNVRISSLLETFSMESTQRTRKIQQRILPCRRKGTIRKRPPTRGHEPGLMLLLRCEKFTPLRPSLLSFLCILIHTRDGQLNSPSWCPHMSKY